MCRIADLAAAGLWGIEAFSSEISESSHEAIASFAAANNLQLTGGSDNHGTLKVRQSCLSVVAFPHTCGFRVVTVSHRHPVTLPPSPAAFSCRLLLPPSPAAFPCQQAYARLGDVHRVETVEYPKLSLWTGFGSKQSVSLRGSARRMRRA